jgi:hypothetical protein
MKIYYKQQQFLRQAHRQIKNYDNSEDKSSIQSSHIAHPPSVPSTSFVRHDYTFNDTNPSSSSAVNTNSTITSDNSLHGNPNNNSTSVNSNTNNSNIILARRSRNAIRPNSSPIGDFAFNEEDSSLPDLIIPTSTLINANSYTYTNSNDEIQDS